MTELEFLWLWICNRFPDWCPLKCEVKGWGTANFHKISMKAPLNKMEYVCAGACMLSCFSCVQLFVTPWTIACQALLSVGFFRQEYWSGLPCPPPGDLSDPGIELLSLTSPALVGGFFTTSTTWAPEKHLLLLYWLCQCLWLCGSQQIVENSSRDGNTRPPYLPP